MTSVTVHLRSSSPGNAVAGSNANDLTGLSHCGYAVQWLIWRSDPMPAALNMAWDETLLEWAAAVERPIMRFYAWSEPAATFGYFQRYRTVMELTQLRPLVRRPTGGGIVPHLHDWTYSIAIPRSHPWYNLPARFAYARIHQWIHSAFHLLGLNTRLAPVDMDGGGQCFAGAAQSDLLFGDRKIAGAAIRRRRDCFITQGSVQPPKCAPPRSEWEASMQLVGSRLLQITWETWIPDVNLEARARELAEQKYSQASYNEAR